MQDISWNFKKKKHNDRISNKICLKVPQKDLYDL